MTRWFSDASVLTRYGIATVNYGTSTGLLDTVKGENLEIEGLVRTAQVYARAAMNVRRRMREEGAMSDDSSKAATLDRLVDAFNRRCRGRRRTLRRRRRVRELARVGPVGTTPTSAVTRSDSGITGRFAALPRGEYGDMEHFVSGNRGFSEWTLRATTAEGEDIEVRGCDIWTFADDLIARKSSFWKIVER